MKKKTVKLVSAVVALGVVSGAYVGVNSYVSSQEKKESEEEDTSVELTSLSTDDITSVAFTAGPSGAITILTPACADRQPCAGPGCPLPYNARPETFRLPQALQYSARNVAFFSGTC